MRILIRNRNKGAKWEIVDSAQYHGEAELQKLLAASPSLIPMDEIREDASPLVAAVPEFVLPGSGQADLLAFTASGDIAVIECKLVANPEIKRKVIGQVLEYGAYLSGMSYQDVDGRVLLQTGKSLADLVAESVEGEEWDEEEFREGVKETLKNGSFILVIAVDEINEELGRTVRFLNECGKPSFSFHALEMRLFQGENTEALLPHLEGTRPQPGQTREKWTEKKFFAAVDADLSAEVAQAIRSLYKWSVSAAGRVLLGTGRQTGSFIFQYLRKDRPVTVFCIYTNGNMALHFGMLSKVLDTDTVAKFHQSLLRIPPFSGVPDDFDKTPSISVQKAFVDQPGALEQFEEVVRQLGEQVRHSG